MQVQIGERLRLIHLFVSMAYSVYTRITAIQRLKAWAKATKPGILLT